ncbi:MAG TPA: ATP-dependent helicase HrpB [Anaeromyxobacteraceae bacterium]|nr:ATP-dependent helicase HrpB [Anaeromyxobacteraceae bacterium]
MQPLPIDPLLPEVAESLRRSPSLVIEAPPGAGKTTRVPRALLEAGLAGAGEVVVLEPRRLAARMAARRVAEELGERAGETVGYQVRFEDVTSERTRIRYVTEALLTRRLLADPRLPGVGAVVLDEFHERHLDGDLALALLRRLQRGPRPELKLVAMSATLDAAPVARFLEAPSLRSEGRAFPVDVQYLSPEEAARPNPRLEQLVSATVKRLARDGLDGHVLVFLPGAAEIRRCGDALAEWAEATGAEVLPLHGDLPPEAQDRAVRGSARRKVILSTNVAETSVTIEGVSVVVDSGLARVASHSPWSGLPQLEVRKVSRASAAQRAGRAGRTQAGRCVRLYTRHDHDSRPEFELPEIAREDLAEPLLALAAAGADGFEWFEAPPPAAAEAAHALLARLGAVEPGGTITELGRRMLRLPLHPRLARLALEADARGAGEVGCVAAALLGERDVRERWGAATRSTPTGPSDLLELVSLFEQATRARFDAGALRRLGLAEGPVRAVDRARRQLRQSLTRTGTARPRGHDEAAAEQAVLAATLAAYPDRVARRRSPGSDEVVLVGGGSARLAPESVVRDAALLVAADAELRKGARPGERAGVLVRVASAVTQELLLDLFPNALRYEESVAWNAAAERVDATERLLYEDLVLEETRAARVDPLRAAEVLEQAALARGARAFADEGAVDRILARVALVARAAPDAGVPPLSEDDVAAALRDLCAGRRSFAELREAGLSDALLARLGPARASLDRVAPDRVTLPGGRGVRVQYEAGEKPPWIESRLQDFFGLAKGPAIAGGRVPLVLHLLAPNQRAVQVTQDLAGFWARHYPAIRRELMRRYPRHAWPEDPLTARPPEPRRR